MKKITILSLVAGMLVVGVLANKAYAFEVYNNTDHDILAFGAPNSWGDWDFGTIPPHQYSSSFQPSLSNLPVNVYVCWKSENCSNPTQNSNYYVVVQQNCVYGVVMVDGTFSSSGKPTVTPNLDGHNGSACPTKEHDHSQPIKKS